jgi:hypothetical protein
VTGGSRPRARWSGARLAVLAVTIVWGLVVGAAPLLLGPPNGDDAYYHAMRAQQQARCWRACVLFPRWYPDLNGGLGGPEPRAYPLVPLVLHAVFALAANDAVWATSAATAAIPPLAGFLMLVAARRRGATPGRALAAAVAWAGAPYLVVALHERAALAEAWGLALLPWVLDSLLPPSTGDRRWLVRGAVAYAVLVACQLPLALMVGIVVAAWYLVGHRGELLRALGAGTLGLALSAFSWLPNVAALWRLQGEGLTSGAYRWDAHLLPGGLAGDPTLGRHLSAVLVAVALALLLQLAGGGREVRVWSAAGLVCVLLATPLAAFLYRLVPGLAYLQFPWRWFALASCLAVFSFLRTGRRLARVVAVLVFLAPLLLPVAWRWRLPAGAPLRPTDPPAVAAAAAARYGVPPVLPSLPAYLPRGVDLAEALANAPASRARVGAAEPAGPSVWCWTVEQREGGTVGFPLLAGPGWEALVDGRPAGWQGRSGLVTVAVGAGRHTVELRQGLLPEDVLGAAATVLALLGAGILTQRGKAAVARRPHDEARA